MTRTFYLVLHFVAGRYFPVASYESEAEAEAHRASLGYKSKIKKVRR
jgi:hypothetical protein